MGPSDVVYVEKRRGPRTDPWLKGMVEAGWRQLVRVFSLRMEGERQVCSFLKEKCLFNVGFLSSGVTRACLNAVGKMPVRRDVLIMCVSAGKSVGEIAWRRWEGIGSRYWVKIYWVTYFTFILHRVSILVKMVCWLPDWLACPVCCSNLHAVQKRHASYHYG